MSKTTIGKRLARLRDELAVTGEDPWTQARVAQEAGLTQNMVARLEQSGAGSIEAFVALILFYYQRGYNINWILLPDNSMVSKLALNDSIKSVDAKVVAADLTTLKQDLSRQVESLIEKLTS
ncbi:hypothetical protein [Hymenobacter tenuis]